MLINVLKELFGITKNNFLLMLIRWEENFSPNTLFKWKNLHPSFFLFVSNTKKKEKRLFVFIPSIWFISKGIWHIFNTNQLSFFWNLHKFHHFTTLFRKRTFSPFHCERFITIQTPPYNSVVILLVFKFFLKYKYLLIIFYCRWPTEIYNFFMIKVRWFF